MAAEIAKFILGFCLAPVLWVIWTLLHLSSRGTPFTMILAFALYMGIPIALAIVLWQKMRMFSFGVAAYFLTASLLLTWTMLFVKTQTPQ